MVNIIVCMKQVLDPEAPVSAYQVDTQARRVVQRGVPPVINPFDENALEAALRIKNTQKSKITTLTAGWNLSGVLARKSLAVGADQAVLLDDKSLEDTDNYASTCVLAAVIKKLGSFDIIFTGRQAADTNAGVTGSGIAEILGIPSITLACKVELIDDRARVERLVSVGREIVEVPLPVLITVTNELGGLRPASLRELTAARKRPVKTWKISGLDVQPGLSNRTRLIDIYIPQPETRCELIGGDTGEELGTNLAVKLKETGLI